MKILITLLFAVTLSAQTTINGGRTFTGPVVFNGTVTGVGGASFATPAALGSIPGTCTPNGTNAFFVATDAPYKAQCTTTNTWTYFLDGFGQATPLATGNFTSVNLGSSVTANNGGIINMFDTENNGQFHGYCASYTTTQVIDIPVDYVIQSTNFPGLVVGFSDGTKYEQIVLLGQGGAPLTFIVQLWATAGASPSNVNSGVTVGAAKIKALRIVDNNTNKIFSYSPDGKNFTTILSETRTTNLTASQYCFGLATNAGNFVNGSFEGVWVH